MNKNGRNHSNSISGQPIANRTQNSVKQYLDRSLSECSNSIAEIVIVKEKPNQFQTIRDEPKHKNTIVLEEDNEGDKSGIEITESSQIQNVDEEETVEIKKPMSSKKSKSLENMNKNLCKTKKNITEKAIIELYKKQYLEKETKMRQIKTQVTSIDLGNGSEIKEVRPLASSRQKTNYIKKNIDFITTINNQLQTNLDTSITELRVLTHREVI